jgi:hypothetical protein
VKDENGDLLADSNNILNRWKTYFSQLLAVHRASEVRQIKIRRRRMHIGYLWEIQKERDHWEVQDVGGWIISKWILLERQE